MDFLASGIIGEGSFAGSLTSNGVFRGWAIVARSDYHATFEDRQVTDEKVA